MLKLTTSLLLLTAMLFSSLPAASYGLRSHPRMFVNRGDLSGLARKARGSMAGEYAVIKEIADRAASEGIRKPRGRFRPPMDMVCAGICYLVERELGNEHEKYARAVKDYWGDGKVLNMEGDGYFGYHGLVFDWIYDSLTPAERRLYADELGTWLRWYTDTPEITLRSGHWWYNQTWGPAHLNTPNTRDGIAPKLMVALGIAGAGSSKEQDARRYLDSWAERVPAECIPAFDESGGVWTESMGHGNYGPVAVIPWSFEVWRTATGQDLFRMCAENSYLRGMTSWAVHLAVPFADNTAWIDDNRASDLGGFARVAPILAARYDDPVAQWVSDRSWENRWNDIPWNRFLSCDPDQRAASPGEAGYAPAKLFPGSGHIYMRSAWDDPDATWAFFGAGPKFAGHSRDDEGHFLIARQGWAALRAGGSGHNDWDYYMGGSLAFNILTIYDPREEFRREQARSGPRAVGNENDGGLIRYVYTSHLRNERAGMKAFHHSPDYTYAAADLTMGYRKSKAREVSRQFLYLRGEREFFVIFDRVESTSPDYPKHWFLHVPDEPEVEGEGTVLVPGHVVRYSEPGTASWRSDPAGEEGVLSTGTANVHLTSLLPRGATLVKRGGEGFTHWGHPDEPTAQYSHVGERSLEAPRVPWRLEVGTGGRTRDYFLHVIEVGGSGEAADVRLVETDGLLGAAIGDGEQGILVRFAPLGELAVELELGGGTVRLEENLK